jgi:hypothetical protein
VDAVVRFAEESTASIEDGRAGAKTDGLEVVDAAPQRPNAGFTPTSVASRMLSSSEFAAVEFSDWMSDNTALAALSNGVAVFLVGATKRANSLPLWLTYWGVESKVPSFAVPTSARTLSKDELEGAKHP